MESTPIALKFSDISFSRKLIILMPHDGWIPLLLKFKLKIPPSQGIRRSGLIMTEPHPVGHNAEDNIYSTVDQQLNIL